MQLFFDHVRQNELVQALLFIASLMLLHFLVQYVAIGFLLRRELARLAAAIVRLRSSPPTEIKSALDGVFHGSRLEPVWRDYAETLHEQSEVRGAMSSAREIRATAPAEVFINAERIVEPRMGSEYFKHLPGILTGFGIIGTFGGLIQGLAGFDPSATDPAVLRRSINGLFGHVQDAFTFSALAITSAIVVTALEKWLYASCVKWVGNVARSLDGLFRAGVGEEYLSGLLRSSEDGTAEVRELKQWMGDDFRALLTHLNDRQIAATQQLASDLAHQIEASLREPLAAIAGTVAEASGRQHESARRVLEKVMTVFIEQMRDTLGVQFGEFSAQMARTADSLAAVEVSMRRLIEDLRKAGQDATFGMQFALRELMDELAEHRKTEAAAVSSATQSLMRQLEEVLERLAIAQEEISLRARDANEAVSAELQSRIAMIAEVNAATTAATRETLERFGSASGIMVDKLSLGAAAITESVAALRSASNHMTRSSVDVTTLEARTTQSAQSLAEASLQLTAVSERVATTVIQLVATSKHLEGVAKLASSETEARSALLKDLRRVMADAQGASAEFGQLAQHVRSLLRESAVDFAGSPIKSLTDRAAGAERA